MTVHLIAIDNTCWLVKLPGGPNYSSKEHVSHCYSLTKKREECIAEMPTPGLQNGMGSTGGAVDKHSPPISVTGVQFSYLLSHALPNSNSIWTLGPPLISSPTI